MVCGSMSRLRSDAGHRRALHHHAGVDHVVLARADQAAVRDRDHPRDPALLLELLIAEEPLRRRGRGLRLGVAVLVEREHVALGGQEDFDGVGHRAPKPMTQPRAPAGALETLTCQCGLGGEVVEVYSNSSSAPKTLSSKALRAPSLSDQERGRAEHSEHNSLRPRCFLRLPRSWSPASFRESARPAQLLLELAVLHQRLCRPLAVRHALVGLAGVVDRGPHVVAQLGVFDESLHVGVRAGARGRLPGLPGRRSRGLRSCSHSSPSIYTKRVCEAYTP